MAQKKITDLTLRSTFDGSVNLPGDDTSQTWRVTGAQLLAYVKTELGPLLKTTGDIVMCGAAVPTGTLSCDGAAVSRTTYATLFAKIGTNFGIGDGGTTFNVPDMRNVMPIGANASTRAVNDGAVTVTHPALALGVTANDRGQGHHHRYESADGVSGFGGSNLAAGTGAVYQGTSLNGGSYSTRVGPPIADAVGGFGIPRTGTTTLPVRLALNFAIVT